MISPQGEQIRDQIKNAIGPMLKAMLEIPLETRRPQFESLMGRTTLPPDVEIVEVEAGGVPCEWVCIAGGAPQPSPRVILYLHGGGYTMGSARADRILSAALARFSGRAVLSVNYRLAPEYPFPAALDDALAAYHCWLSTGKAPGLSSSLASLLEEVLPWPPWSPYAMPVIPCRQGRSCFLLQPISLPVVPLTRPTSRVI